MRGWLHETLSPIFNVIYLQLTNNVHFVPFNLTSDRLKGNQGLGTPNQSFMMSPSDAVHF